MPDTRKVKECLGSLCLSVPLGLGAVLLPLAWFVVVPFFIDAATMGVKYVFTPTQEGSYFKWGLAMFILMPFLLVFVPMALCMRTHDKRASRWAIYIIATVYVALIALGHSLGAAQTREREGVKEVFVAKFNDLYCSVRAFQACAQNNQRDILDLVGRSGAASVLRDAENVSTAAFSIWTRCLDAEQENTVRISPPNSEQGFSNAPIYDLLNDCRGSRDIDVWCGRYHVQNKSLSIDEHFASTSPFASNAHMFDKYVREWARRMLYTDALLGSAVGCMLLMAWSLKARDAA